MSVCKLSQSFKNEEISYQFFSICRWGRGRGVSPLQGEWRKTVGARGGRGGEVEEEEGKGWRGEEEESLSQRCVENIGHKIFSK